jgi:hypothetical protein
MTTSIGKRHDVVKQDSQEETKDADVLDGAELRVMVPLGWSSETRHCFMADANAQDEPNAAHTSHKSVERPQCLRADRRLSR